MKLAETEESKPASAGPAFAWSTVGSALSYAVPALLATLAAFAPLMRMPQWAFLALVCVVLLWDVYRIWGKRSSLGHRAVIRALVAGAVALSFSSGSAHQDISWITALAFVGVAFPVLIESSLGKGVSKRTAFAANLPGLRPAEPLPAIARPLMTASAAVLLLGSLLSSLGGRPVIWLGLVILLDLFYAGVLIAALARIQRDRTLRAALPGAVADYQPEFIIYTALPDDAPHQVMMWAPYLARTGRRFIIVTRHERPARTLAAMTDAPVIARRSIADLESVLTDSIKAVFYCNASSGNSTMVRYPEYTHVFLGHGDSDKPTSYNPLHAMYDRIFAAGPAATRRYGAHGVIIDPDRFEIVGRPQLESVERFDSPMADVEDPTVLYAPTWRGHVEETMLYSLPVAAQMLRRVLDHGARVIFRPHPFSYQFDEDVAYIDEIKEMLAADARQTGRQHIFGEAAESDMDVVECANLSDAMISDVSSVVSDYLYSGKPFAMVAVSAIGQDFVDEYPIARASYVLNGDLSNLDETLTALLRDDPRQAERIALRADYLGDFPAEGYAEHFIDAARRSIDENGSKDNEETDLDENADEDSDAPAAPAQNETDQEDDAPEDAAGNRSVFSTIWNQLAGRTIAPALFGVLTFGFAILPVPHAVTATCGLIGTLAYLLIYRRVIRRRGRSTNLLRASNGARALIVFALTFEWVTVFGRSWIIVVAGLILLLSIVLETSIIKSWRVTGLEARNLPGVETRGYQPFGRGNVAIASSGTTAIAWILSYSGILASVALVLSLITLAMAVFVCAAGLVRGLRSARLEVELPELLDTYGAEFAVYFGSTMGIGYQLGMWDPYFARMGRRYIVITRSLKMMRAAQNVTDAPIINRSTLRSLETVITPSLKAAFYVNNAGKNSHFIERREMTHVWLNHGDSEKPACFNPVHAIYDKIFSAGQAGVDRYARHGVDIPRQKFDIVGRPQVEKIERVQTPVGEIEKPTVLYAPTWKGPYKDTAFYSLPRGEEIVGKLLSRGCTVVFRAHSLNYRFPEAREMIGRIGAMLDADLAATGRQHIWGQIAEKEMGLEECFNVSDAMIADVSAVVSDYLQSQKPLAMVSVGRTREQLEEDAPVSRASYVIADDLGNLDDMISLLLGEDPLVGDREQMRKYYLGDFSAENYADVFVAEANGIIDSKRAEAAARTNEGE
ncbi:CDP-glycerol glycerophosphotransferase family protein [Brevibacterium sp. GP-SGM9]|uniref:CDP-glycerol glycerophosphotransferase family protein n=1 Tax=Brevibacterium sp. GP-SGM9 TaxID=3376990 RepID=UPI0039A4206E